MNSIDVRNFALSGVPIKLVCQSSNQLSLISNQWQRFFVLEDEIESSPAVVYSFTESAQASSLPPRGIEVSHSEHLVVLKTAHGFLLRCGSSTLDVDVANGRCQGVLTPAFWDLPLEYQRELFLISFLMLLRPFGLYGLHANGLLHKKRGYLVAGDAGHGKTTLSLALVRQGWGFLSDDILTLTRSARGIEALAFKQGFSCTTKTTTLFPEFKEMVDESPIFLDGKKLVDIEQAYPGSFHATCYPDVLLFPFISSETDSKLMQIEPAQSLVALLEQSPGIMLEQPMVIEQMNVLEQLVAQSRCFQLQLGSDVFEAPQAVAELLASIPASDTPARDQVEVQAWAK